MVAKSLIAILIFLTPLVSAQNPSSKDIASWLEAAKTYAANKPVDTKILSILALKIFKSGLCHASARNEFIGRLKKLSPLDKKQIFDEIESLDGPAAKLKLENAKFDLAKLLHLAYEHPYTKAGQGALVFAARIQMEFGHYDEAEVVLENLKEQVGLEGLNAKSSFEYLLVKQRLGNPVSPELGKTLWKKLDKLDVAGKTLSRADLEKIFDQKIDFPTQTAREIERVKNCSSNPLVASALTGLSRDKEWIFKRPEQYLSVALTADGACGIRTNHTVRCWGPENSEMEKTPLGKVKSLAVGRAHACAVLENGDLSCWGDIETYRDIPPGKAKAVVAGYSSTCAHMADDSVKCWGFNSDPAPKDIKVESMIPSSSFICAKLRDKTGKCWGNLSASPERAPQQKVDYFAMGYLHACARLEDKTIRCWGDTESDLESGTPKLPVETLVSGARHSCAKMEDKTVRCWGHRRSSPENVPKGKVQSLVAGGMRTCAKMEDKSIQCWGGIDNTDPPKIPEGRAEWIVAGNNHVCAKMEDKSVKCWGDSNALARVPDKIESLVVGDSHACAILENKSIKCWAWGGMSIDSSDRESYPTCIDWKNHCEKEVKD